MAEADDDLRATTDSIQADLEKLKGIETQKGGLDITDPEVRELSDDAEAIAARVHREATAERELVEEANGEGRDTLT
jgi:hypothetical protein